MNDKWRISEDAQLSIDFVIGFTIFMIAFIFVATMMSGLLVNLQSQTIDYDAVAYRTGVMLVEDPGEPCLPGNPEPYWHLIDLSAERDDVKRLGLSIGKNAPEILQEAKVEKFFRWEPSDDENKDVFYYPDDYRQKLIFGDYPYNFNITLKEIGGEERYWNVGPETPENAAYGYARRAVLIKKPSFTEINVVQNNTTNTQFYIQMYFQKLFHPSINPRYTIDPIQEDIIIELHNFTVLGTRLESIVLKKDTTSIYDSDDPYNSPMDSPTIHFYVDEQEYHNPYLIDLTNNTRILIDNGFFTRRNLKETESSEVKLLLTFNKAVNEVTIPLDFQDIAHTPLSPAILEVKVW